MNTIKGLEEYASARRNIIEEANLSGDSEVQKFYSDAIVFITGGSGFIGKQLIEKLLRSTNIKKIYVLLRPKKGSNAKERLEKLLKDSVYDDIHVNKPSFIDKIVPIEGDVSDINLGIDEKNWSILADEVNIILHAAATINFTETIKLATLTNVRGTREMLKLARDCKNIKSIVYVSTAYSHATKDRVKQEVKDNFYDSPISPKCLIDLSETIDENTLNEMVAPLMQQWPNSYTFTKAVSEELIRTHGGDLPICIVRPAIVISSFIEPVPGWIDHKNALGPSGIILGISYGVNHTSWCDTNTQSDVVPVDFVNNAIIASAWKTYTRYGGGDGQIVIYTITRTKRPLTITVFHEVFNYEYKEFLYANAVWYGFMVPTTNFYVYMILNWILHLVPALLADGACLLIGKKPRFMKVYKMASSLHSVLSYYNRNEWIFLDTNTHQLFNSLSETDRILYDFDVPSIEPKHMVYTWSYGIKKYIAREDLGNIEEAKRRQRLLRIAHYITFPVYIFILFYILYTLFVFAYKGFSSVHYILCNDNILTA